MEGSRRKFSLRESTLFRSPVRCCRVGIVLEEKQGFDDFDEPVHGDFVLSLHQLTA